MNEQAWITVSNILAILIGPVVAVRITLWHDKRRAERDRRMAIFRDLMQTRTGLALTPLHVLALNLVEIEFHKNTDVIEAWKKYRENLSKPVSINGNEQQARREERSHLLAKLLHTMGKSLGFDIEQLRILEGNYTPQGWADDEQQQKALRLLLIDTLNGHRAVPITRQIHPKPSSPYPPPPEKVLQ